MKLTRQSTSVVVTLLAVALAGIVTVQMLSWRQVRRLADEAFRANVHAALAHEFKTPLSTVTLAGDAMADAAGSGNDEAVTKFRRVIADECRRLRVQVERVLEVAALERRGPAGLNLAPVDLHDVLRVALENFEPRVTARQGRIEAALDASRHHVIGDEVHLLNVLHNLLDNALKYTARPPAIRVTTVNTARTVRLAVEDNGIGIPPGQRRRIFEPFYRAPHGGVDDVQGFGIGLSYVARVVAGHGGSIGVRGGLNGGSVFEIESARQCRALPTRGRHVTAALEPHSGGARPRTSRRSSWSRTIPISGSSCTTCWSGVASR